MTPRPRRGPTPVMRTHSPPLSLRKRRPRGGLTIVELTVAMSALMIAMLAIASSSRAARTLRHTDSEQQLAGAALDSMMRTAKAASHAASSDAAGWGNALAAALAPGGSVGCTFDVPGLDAWDASTSVGILEVILDETLTDAELGVDLGLPRDLDKDRTIDNPDVRAGAQLLPVVITLRWRGAGGPRQLTRGFYLRA
ncbi:MAG: type II secretory pathway pseudopilin PulG [Chlamydiales bacterium]|jgi:type II secretory pathway pseudopilin PulG